jgi:hypothetical protein
VQGGSLTRCRLLYTRFIRRPSDRHRFFIGIRRNLVPRVGMEEWFAMRGGVFKPSPDWDLGRGRSASEANDIAVAIAHHIAALVMAVAGPVFWMVLTLGLAVDLLG